MSRRYSTDGLGRTLVTVVTAALLGLAIGLMLGVGL